MAVDLIAPFVNAWSNYVFGSPIIAGLVFMFFIMLWGMRRGWSLEIFIALFIPLLAILAMPSIGIVPVSILGIIIIGLGVLIALGLISLIKR
jgi:hypothetical protein